MKQAWINYNQSVAEKNKIVAHGAITPSGDTRKSFFRNMDEAAAGMATGVHSPFIVLEELSGGFTGVLPGARKKVRTRIYFLGHVHETLNDLNTVQTTTETVMIQFLSRYSYDLEVLGACGPFSKFDPSKATFAEVGPLLQNAYGWRIDLEFLNPAPELNYNPEKWLTNGN